MRARSAQAQAAAALLERAMFTRTRTVRRRAASRGGARIAYCVSGLVVVRCLARSCLAAADVSGRVAVRAGSRALP